jgi:hypothetical protein
VVKNKTNLLVRVRIETGRRPRSPFGRLHDMPTNIKLRVACDADFDFARNLYFETMRWIIERLFGWDEVRENKNFAQFFKIDEVKIITADDQDVGWIQEQIDDTSINLGSILCDASHAASGALERKFFRYC